MKNFLTLQSVETVLGHLRALPVLPAETVPLTEALGRRLAEALHAPADLPGFDRSTVDGFAVRARDVFGAQEGSPALLECVGDCPMGAVPDISLQPGQCARILTGGMLPEGADCVVMVEYSRPAGGNMVELTRTQAPGDHVVRRDEDAAAGDCITPAGRKLRPQEIGLLALVLLFAGRLVYDYAPYSEANQRLLTFLLTTAILSLGLGLFNLIPIPPLDGSKVLFSLLPDRAYNTMLRYERYGMLLLWAVVLLGVGDRRIGAAGQCVYVGVCRVVGY